MLLSNFQIYDFMRNHGELGIPRARMGLCNLTVTSIYCNVCHLLK